jgi:hypothetical protein
LGVTRETEMFRLIAATEAGANITTTLGGSREAYTLRGRGDFVEFSSGRDFVIDSDEPIMVGNVTLGQEAVGIPFGLPGGDPSFIVIPPIEQFRESYVFLTPDQYAFDFLRVVAPRAAELRLDGRNVADLEQCLDEDEAGLRQTLASSVRDEFVVYRCQLSFPVLDPEAAAEDALSDGDQSGDGVHELQSDLPVLVIVDGFDVNVSYGYAGGTELREILAR